MRNEIKFSSHIISCVTEGSIAEELGVEPGDILLAVNDTEPEDIFDYHYLTNDTEITLLIQKPDGEQWELEIEKDYEEDLGIVFENGLMDDYRSCRNKCIFCFIDQMPPGMRETLYFKDDDSRLSFLQGNYITLTNLSDHDAERIIKYHMAPINVSVHTTNPALRCKMLNNRFAGAALKRIDQFYEAGIEMNGQIVLCPGWNDGEELDRTIADLEKYIPIMESLSVVPIGMTKYREGLEQIEPVDTWVARDTIDRIEKWQKRIYEKHGIYFVHASDEFYMKAGRELPPEERYDGYPQLENGVGMVRLFLDECMEALLQLNEEGHPHEITVATGRLMKDYIQNVADAFCRKYPEVTVHVRGIRNDFFGEQITVSGLVTGGDIINQLKGQELGECVLIPINMLRSGEKVFLDDITISQAETALQVPIRIVKSSGADFVRALFAGTLGMDEEAPCIYEGYEV